MTFDGVSREICRGILIPVLFVITDLVRQVYPRKPKQVFLHVSPLLWQLLGSGAAAGGGGNAHLRQALGNLIASLYANMGQELIQVASQNSNVTPKMKSLLQDLIENP